MGKHIYGIISVVLFSFFFFFLIKFVFPNALQLESQSQVNAALTAFLRTLILSSRSALPHTFWIVLKHLIRCTYIFIRRCVGDWAFNCVYEPGLRSNLSIQFWLFLHDALLFYFLHRFFLHPVSFQFELIAIAAKWMQSKTKNPTNRFIRKQFINFHILFPQSF